MPAGNLETQLSIVVTEMLIWSGSILPQVIQFNSIQFPNILVSIVPFNSSQFQAKLNYWEPWPVLSYGPMADVVESGWRLLPDWSNLDPHTYGYVKLLQTSSLPLDVRFMSKRFQNFTADQSRPNLYTTKIRKPSHWSWLCRRPRNITTFIQLNSTKCCS